MHIVHFLLRKPWTGAPNPGPVELGFLISSYLSFGRQVVRMQVLHPLPLRKPQNQRTMATPRLKGPQAELVLPAPTKLCAKDPQA
jgi:hypothetical protein